MKLDVAGEIKKLNLSETDICILETAQTISTNQVKEITKAFNKIIPNKTYILHSGIKLSVVSPVAELRGSKVEL